MEKEKYFEALDLYRRFCDLCVDSSEFNTFTLEEQNNSFMDFISCYESCEMDKYISILYESMAISRSCWNNEDFKNFTECLYNFNLRCENAIHY